MAENGTDTRARLLDLLLTKVAEDTFPSGVMMDLIEELLQPDDVPAYAAVLMDKISEETYPSVPMMRRLVALTES
ncbi:hypothetical protein [Nocardioides sp. YIM 152315]|uniref:hypothetical protein n=1 Tax=Nocardioides sp. YIM 152315 TaxID=3031760 RepID=UPI0023DAFBB8|nr:hypothetical protein [Nocardioides sp. YIM 152315]MDF1602522.1 hypothetical protein [Nocardioides sp. YIM 152315]